MGARARWVIEWATPAGLLQAREPWPAEVAEHAARLADFYNHPPNRRMLTNTTELSAAEVVLHYRALEESGARPFLFTLDGALVGDADLRRVTGAEAEVAILIGEPAQQGRGLGRYFGIMLHAFAFEVMRLERLYAAIIPENRASLRLFEKLGHAVDASPPARRFADEPSDVTTSTSRGRFATVVGLNQGGPTFRERPVS